MSETILTAVSGSSSTLFDINGALNPNVGQVPQPDRAYMIDWSKLTSVNDLILILQMLGIAFPGNHPGIPQIQKFLDFQNSVPLNEAMNPSSEKLK